MSSASGTIISTIRICRNVPINLSSNIASLVTFLFSGQVVLLLGLAAGVFSIAGHYVGSGLVLKNGTKIIRPIILVVLTVLFVKIIFDF